MNILYFAWLKTRTGTAEEKIDLPADVATVADLIAFLKDKSPGHAEAFANMDIVRAAVNQEYVDLDHPVAAGDEVAFFPPVTGG